ncbi:conserved hypothetical protein [Burkholderiales bacterium]|nr:conserved hypothetical protein [Burkholderiales bacterium]
MTVVIDGRELEPPEPLQRVLAALDVLADGEEMRVLLYCHPVPLISILESNGYAWQETLLEDGTHELRIRRPRP